MQKVIDLRSDTVTRPSAGMRRAMAEAEVGDDVFGEDPTVNRLQEMVASLLGKEASLYVPSGTMANQLAIRSQTHHGDEVIVEADAHIVRYEAGAASALSGVQCAPLTGERGILDPEQIEEAIRPPNLHHPPTTLICLENTHNRGGGSIYPLEKIRRIGEIAKRHGVRVHLDGARLFNASVATGIPLSEYARHCDTVSLCLSKGLGAPVGSLVAGPAPLIDRARRYRKMFGGGMRQAGIIAAGGIYALERNIPRLAEDHEKAGILAQGLAGIPTLRIDPARCETNIVIFDIGATGYTGEKALHRLTQEGLLLVPFGKTLLRAVTHLDVSFEDIEQSLEILRRVFQGGQGLSQ